MGKATIISNAKDAVKDIRDGSVVMLGGFGGAGAPDRLIEALCETSVRDLVVISNHCGKGDQGLARLLAEGHVRKMVSTYAFHRDAYVFRKLYEAGEVTLEMMPQGTLAERIRAAGAGIPAFYTPTGAGTVLTEDREVRKFDDREYLLETALHADFALIHAWKADGLGNLVYRKTARNFNPIMATAAGVTIAEAEEIVEVGKLDPEAVITPFLYVNRLVDVGRSDERLN